MTTATAVPSRAKRTAQPSRDVAWGALRSAFAPHGFRVHELSLRRVVAPAVQVVHARYRADRRRAVIRFTLDLGVFFPQAYAKIRTLRERKTPRRGSRDCMCTIRCNVGALLGPTMAEHWWTLTPTMGADDVREMVSDAVDNAAVPWLDRFSNPRLAMDETDPFDAISLALMMGDLDTARRLTQCAQVEFGPSDRLVEWARKRWLVP
jgi:hypothetical protein